MFQADFYDGLSAKAKTAWVEVHEDAILVTVDSNRQTYLFKDIEVQAKLGQAKRIIDLPDGARLEAANIDALENAMPSASIGFWKALHYIENHLAWVMFALVGTVFAGWMFLQYGVPKLAEYVAKATPPRMEKNLGEQVLKGLDHKFGYFKPSKVKQTRQDEIAQALAHLCQANDCPPHELMFRDGGPIGANAFALPGGIMVVTDGLVELAQSDDEIIAVLAHELGHVQQRHAFRQSIQSTLAGLMLAAVTGDVSTLGSGLPAALMQMRYSREHELEADRYALASLQQSCLPPRAFAEILYRLQRQHVHGEDEKTEDDKEGKASHYNPVNDMFSTHPDSMERIKPFLEAKPAC